MHFLYTADHIAPKKCLRVQNIQKGVSKYHNNLPYTEEQPWWTGHRIEITEAQQVIKLSKTE
jgi:hypothetical protein